MILESDIRKVLYSKCENPDRSKYVILKDSIKEIKYANGRVDHLNNSSGRKKKKANKKSKKKEKDLSHLTSLERNSTELNAYESDLARAYAWLAIVCFLSIPLFYFSTIILAILIFLLAIPCFILAFKFGYRVMKRGEVEKGSKEHKQARFGIATGLVVFTCLAALALLFLYLLSISGWG